MQARAHACYMRSMLGPAGPLLTQDANSTGDNGAPRVPPALLCIDGDRSFLLKIPASGELVIGRGPEAGFAVDDPLVSRTHAHLLLVPEGIRITDLGSRHGTLLNGDRIHDPRILRSGDVVTIGNTLLIARATKTPRVSNVVEPAPFARRLAEELARCTQYERELSVLVVRARDGSDSAQLLAACAERLRTIDIAAAIGPRHLGLLLPELGVDEAMRFGTALAAGNALAVGVATAPHEGVDPDSLLAAARAACELHVSGRIVRASEANELIELGGHRIVVAEPAMAKLYELARRVARSSIPVLIHGETGVGKELAAATVHACSPRSGEAFISVNCAAIPESLAESELFGHVKGAFSGAIGNKQGYIEAAAGGTLFLDEIGELPPAIQAKLLRVLESGELIRVGEVKPKKIDIRIVAATNRDLQKEIEDGRFRSDLYFRLGAARLEIPPLRERPRDLAVLVTSMLADACRRLDRPPLELSISAAVALYRHDWPGNIRELRHVVEYAAAAVADNGTEVALWHLPKELAATARRERDTGSRDGGAAIAASAAAPVPSPGGPNTFRPIADEVRDLERSRMIAALRAANGVQNRAAELIEMPLRTFVTKLKRYAIAPAEYA
jgi:two-component system, NtrC family, response regulator AtoC